MGLFGFLKKKGETIQLPPEEPEFLKEVDLSASGAAQGVREEVEPELALWLSNGTAATGLKELASALRKMKASDYKEHVNPERNEIAEWVQEILNDSGLARKLRKAKGKMQAAKAIEKEIKALKSAKKIAAKAKKPMPAKKLKEEPKLQLQETPELPEMGEKLQNIKLPYDSFEEKIHATGKKRGLFSRLFGKKPKEEVLEQLQEDMPILPEITELPEMQIGSSRLHIPHSGIVPEPLEELKAAKAMKDITKKLTKKAARIAARKAEKELKELPQLNPSEELHEELQTPIEIPRIEDFQTAGQLEPLTEEATETKKERKGFLGFLFKRKESAAEEQPTEFAALPQLPEELNQDKPELPAQKEAAEFEPEPHHAKWEETPAPAGLPEETMSEETEELEPEITATASRSGKTKGRARQPEEYDDLKMIRQDQELERTEKELTRQEEELNNRRLELTRKRYELIKQKGELESKKFEEFIRKHKSRNEKEEAIVRDELFMQESTAAMPDFGSRGNEPTGTLRGMPDFRLSAAYGKERLEELLEEAKQHIRQNNMEEAQNALHEVQSVFDTVYMTNNEKKQIEYEILEVEADLKLASLK
ncbi:hypothetical protein HYU40_02975 [Candidatus Woesearchaeota archaeon]|nr:hypothetical protein [Candidatus Woesearchaeota archaeon]